MTRSPTAAPSCAGARLEDALAHLVEDLPTGAEPPRPAVLALLREALATGRTEIRRRFEEPGPCATTATRCWPPPRS
jgi:hypothetical protein